MSARPVLLTDDEHQELDRRLTECASETALRQYLAQQIVLEQLVAAVKARSLKRIEATLRRLTRPSLTVERQTQASHEPPPIGEARLL